MKSHQKINMTSQWINRKFLQALHVLLFAFSISYSHAAITDLGTAPLVSATTGDVLPNLMYILDNSGSMGWDYMPDFVNDANKCKSVANQTAIGSLFTAGCGFGDPPYMAKDFNSIYYNPEITYSPGLNADGSEKTAMTSANTAGWTQIRLDAYGVQGGTSVTSLVPNTLTTGYPDRVWCNKTNNVTTTDLYDPLVCRNNSQYIYPNNNGTQSESFNQAYTARGYPYYYNVQAGEYCTDKNLTTCITSSVATATHTYPAKVRWCNSDTAVTTGLNCQAKYIETTGYTRARWTGIKISTVGTIKLRPDTLGCGGTNQPSCAAPSAISITNITVNGTRIIPTTPSPALTITDTSSASARSTLAQAIRDAINNHVSSPDFVAVATGDEVTIQPVAAGPFSGNIAVTASSAVRAAIPGDKAIGSFVISGARNTTSVTNVKVNSVEIMNQTQDTASTTDDAASRTALANKIVARINAYTSAPDYVASSNGASTPTITITASNFGTASNGSLVVTKGGTSSRLTISSVVNLAGGTDGIASKTYTIPYTIAQFSGSTPVVTTFDRVDIEPFKNEYPKASSRTDCLSASICSYDEEMTNFANWYSYYRTRMQMMKTSTSRAFKTIDTRYRVGFITIAPRNSSGVVDYLPIAQFNAGQKSDWYDILLATKPETGTPLRSALSRVGRIYAGKNPVSGFTADPVQFSCQQNFSILTTDGYWNTDSNGDVRDIAGSGSVGNLDGVIASAPRPMYEGPTPSSNSLADAAKYYYDTDLRNGASGSAECTGSTRPNGTKGDVCDNNVFVTTTDNNLKQHMTTFTLGLGVDATLTYTTDYKTATEGDFYELKQGTRNWPVPLADSQTAVDDLWHAAVNGQGSYFSAKDPNQLAYSLDNALSSIKAKVGAGAAAATSTLNPVSGDNFTYVASYTSVKWTGNLEARTINTDTGRVSEDAVWCVENVLADSCAAPSTVVTTVTGNSTVYQCVTPGASLSTCSAPGIFDTGSNSCKVEISSACTGTLQTKVSDSIDTRNIYMNVNGALASFSSGNLQAAGRSANFENAYLAVNLSQWSTLTADQKALINPASLVNFLRGNNGYEDRASNVDGTDDNRLYRFRETTLGDLVDSTPVYVSSPKANYADPGYGPDSTVGSFKTAQAGRAANIYIGANDGMLHAIAATTGEERWAYVPSMVLDNMWKLADKNYGNGVDHSYYVDGDIVINDVCISDCTSTTSAVWKTILVAGLNGGGKGYFALDITNPGTPVLLWEFASTPDTIGDISFDSDLGYSYGNPIITKKSDGTWVVVITSGYNNTTGSNAGKGFLYVLNATNGTILTKYATGAGDSATPSGLAKINAYVNEAETNNEAKFVYGGDLLGNLWRFDVNNAQSSTNPFKIAVLKDPSGNTQPITVRPELAEINGKRILYVGTGRYLGTSDLTDTQQQSIYAISDDSSVVSTLDSPRTSSTMVNQVLINDTATATRTIQSPAKQVNFATGRGWYIDFPDSGERQNVPAQLVFGTLLLPTTVPSNTVCSPGGYGWLNFLNYKTGASVAGNAVASRTNAPIVGMNILYVKGKPVVNVVTADNPTPQFPPQQPEFTGGNASGFTNHRVIWRELIDE